MSNYKDIINDNQLNRKIDFIFPAEEIYANASVSPEVSEHTLYLQRKKLTMEDIPGMKFGYYFQYPSLIFPMRDLSGRIKSIQHIYYDQKGGKQERFLKEGEKEGTFLALDPIENGKKILITEGVATAASLRKILHSSTDHNNFIVIAAFTAGDIPKIAKLLKKRFLYSEIISTPDADESGNDAAKKCKEMGVDCIFPPQWKKGNDWSDVYLELGIQKALNEFENALAIQAFSSCPSHETPKEIPEIKKILESLDDDPCQGLSMKHFPILLQDYIYGICNTTEAHPIMVILSVLCSISAMVGKKVYIPKGIYFQNLYPNIWSICINKSGGFKTTALNKGSEIALEADLEILEMIQEIRNQGNPHTGLFEDISKLSQELQIKLQEKSLQRPILPTRISTEFLIKHLSEGHQGMIISSEIGEWLGNMQKQHNVDLKQIFTYFYDVDIAPYEHRTKHCGSYIVKEPFITINGVSTIEWIQSQVKSDDVFGGFFPRNLLFAPPFNNSVPEALPKAIKESEVMAEAKRKISETLKNIGEIRFSLPVNVEEYFRMIHSSLYQMVRVSKYDERCQKFLEPYLKRWSPYILKLAMLFRIIEDPLSNELSISSLKAATEIIRIAIKSTAKLFEKELGESQDQKKQRLIYERIAQRAETGKTTKFHDLLRRRILDGNSKEYEEVLETLEDSGKIVCLNSEIKNKKNREYGLAV